MKLGIALIIIGGMILGINLWASFALLSIGDSPAYIFTGLALPAILLYFGIRRVSSKRHEHDNEQ